MAESQALEQVELALPNVVMFTGPRTPVVEKCTPTVNPNYAMEHYVQRCQLSGIYPPSLPRPYEMIGLEDAWTMVSGSGLELHGVQAGVYDSAAWGETGEYNFTDGPRLGGLSAAAIGSVPIGERRERSSHGTDVVHTLAADHRVGRSIGVASVLGSNLSVTVHVQGDDMPRFQLVVPDAGEEENGEDEGEGQGADGDEQGEEAQEDDPTWVYHNQQAYIFRTLVRLKELVEAGASIINVSMGPILPGEEEQALATTNRLVHEAFERFVSWALTKHGDVLFVVAAGNDGVPVSSVGEWFGQRVPNVITVGGLDHRGERVYFSNYMAEVEGVPSVLEVSLAAPAVGIVTHHDRDGFSVTQCGNSFAAPMVSGAAAIPRSLKPDLTAG